MLLKIEPYIVPFALLLLVTGQLFAQDNRATINGFVRNDTVVLENIHIINKNTQLGTFSNENGAYSIQVQLGDYLLFKSLNHIDRIIKISETHLQNRSITVYLEPQIYELDEVVLQKSEKIPLKIFTHKNIQLDKDYLDRIKPPSAVERTDPTLQNASIDLIWIFTKLYKLINKKNIEKRKEKKRITELKNAFPGSIVSTYGESFFTEWLHIHPDKIYIFIDYCIDNGLADYYSSDEIVIKDFFVKQSKKFNAID